MIGALVSILSLEVTRRLVTAGVVAATLAVTGATNATPVVIQTATPHGFVRPAHGIVDGVGGNDGANGLWVATPVDATHLVLTSFDDAGALVNSAGTGAYSGAGTFRTAFPDGAILLGRRNVAMQTAVATPRIVFVPLGSPAWGLDPYGGVIPTGTLPARLSAQTAEQRLMKQSRQLATERQRFEVHVTGSASPASPDFGDFDVTQAVYQTLYACMFDLISPSRGLVLSGEWTSQRADATSLDTRGQKWVGVVEISQPVIDNPLEFIPIDTVGVLTTNLAGGGSADAIVILVPVVP
jgi:hypothetical protein